MYSSEILPPSFTETKKSPVFSQWKPYKMPMLEYAEEQIRAYEHKCLKKRQSVGIAQVFCSSPPQRFRFNSINQLTCL